MYRPVAPSDKAADVAPKRGRVGPTKALAVEASATCPAVTAYARSPGYFGAPLVEAQTDRQAVAYAPTAEAVVADVLLERNAVKRLIEPEQVAALVACVRRPGAWPRAGAAILIDAGWLAH